MYRLQLIYILFVQQAGIQYKLIQIGQVKTVNIIYYYIVGHFLLQIIISPRPFQHFWHTGNLFTFHIFKLYYNIFGFLLNLRCQNTCVCAYMGKQYESQTKIVHPKRRRKISIYIFNIIYERFYRQKMRELLFHNILK